jgi:hypothetical protein
LRGSSDGDREAQRLLLECQLRAGNAAIAAAMPHREALGSTASTTVNGRRLFSNGSGTTSTDDAVSTSRIGAINADSVALEKPAPATTVRVTNAVKEQVSIIWEAVCRARQLLDKGIAALKGVDSLPEKTMKALDTNFHNVDRTAYPARVSLLYEIQNSLAKTRAAFDGEIPIAVNDESDKNTLGYVTDYWLFTSDIHLHPLWFAQGPEPRARIVVHEACHKFDNDDDHAYQWQGKYQTLSPAEAADNADSYAWFCTDVS